MSSDKLSKMFGGPWEYKRMGDYYMIVTSKGGIVIEEKDNGEGWEKAYHLMALAPEMLEALESVECCEKQAVNQDLLEATAHVGLVLQKLRETLGRL